MLVGVAAVFIMVGLVDQEVQVVVEMLEQDHHQH
jgi:hypothetical protein